MNCPGCGSSQIHRSRRQGFFERVVLSALLIRPYRCRECRARFLRPSRHAGSHFHHLFAEPPLALRVAIWSVVIIVASLVVAAAVIWYTGGSGPEFYE